MMDRHLSSMNVEAEDSLQHNTRPHVRHAASALIRKSGKRVRCDTEEQQPSQQNGGGALYHHR